MKIRYESPKEGFLAKTIKVILAIVFLYFLLIALHGCTVYKVEAPAVTIPSQPCIDKTKAKVYE